jgi:hypothetical protein
MNRIPVDDAIAYSVSRLVDDAMTEKREPSHSEIEFTIKQANLMEMDPNKLGASPVGKMKRVRSTLVASIEKYPERAEIFACGIINLVRSNGGFREQSPNYVGSGAIENLISELRPKGILLSKDGQLSQLILDGLESRELTDALRNYVDRAKKGYEDAALIVGTSKDLLEAVAAHVLKERIGNYSTTNNFPTLLGQAFITLGMATSVDKRVDGEHPRKDIERNMFDLACSINRLRNKQGTGHGRPFIPDLTNEESKEAIQIIGIIADKMLKKL